MHLEDQRGRPVMVPELGAAEYAFSLHAALRRVEESAPTTRGRVSAAAPGSRLPLALGRPCWLLLLVFHVRSRVPPSSLPDRGAGEHY